MAGLDFLGEINPVSLGLNTLAGGIQIASGAHQIKQGKELAKRNVRPELGNLVTGDYENLLNLYEQQAQYGIDPGSLNFVAGKNEDALQATLQSMLLAGGSPNAVGNAYRNFTGAMSDLGVMESERRWDKIKTLAPITEQLADAKLQRFLYDKDAPYKDKAQEASLKMNTGYQQLMAGIDTVVGGGIKQATDAYATPEEKAAKKGLKKTRGGVVTDLEIGSNTGQMGARG